MQSALQITFRDMPPSEALETRIRDKVAKLEKFHPHITSCRVTVEESHRHQNQGRHFGVKVEVHVPGGQPVVASLKHDEDVYVAVRDALGAVRRRLEEGLRETRGAVKAHETPRHGKVARVFAEEGFGFIQTDDGARVLLQPRQRRASPLRGPGLRRAGPVHRGGGHRGRPGQAGERRQAPLLASPAPR